MSTIASLRFEYIKPKNKPCCLDLVDFCDDLDEIGIEIGVGEFSKFVIHVDNLNVEQHLPEDFDYVDEINVAKLGELKSQIGPWFEISEGLQIMQAIIKEISRRSRSDEYSASSLNDLVEIASPTLKRFKLALNKNSDKSNRFRIELC